MTESEFANTRHHAAARCAREKTTRAEAELLRLHSSHRGERGCRLDVRIFQRLLAIVTRQSTVDLPERRSFPLRIREERGEGTCLLKPNLRDFRLCTGPLL